jgi:uncharacterized membrane protein (DUF106 family)
MGIDLPGQTRHNHDRRQRRLFMDVAGARKFHISRRSLAMVIPLITLLMTSVFWNLRQHQLIEQKHIAAQREEAARVKEEAKQTAERMKKNAEWAASDARVQQLYREISNLSEVNERLVSEPQRSASRKIANALEAGDSP